MSTSIDMSNNVILDKEPTNVLTENEQLQDNVNDEKEEEPKPKTFSRRGLITLSFLKDV